MEIGYAKVEVPKKFRKFGKLPGKPSELIRLALSDFIAAEKKFEINMSRWYVVNGKCSVCFAGAVMAGTLGKTRDDVKELGLTNDDGEFELFPRYLGREGPALAALNEFREGRLDAGFRQLGLKLPPHVFEKVDIYSYTRQTRLSFRRDMRALATALEKEGY